MALSNCPAFFYGSDILLMRWPSRPPVHIDVAVGARAVSAVGIPTTHEVRRDSLFRHTVRFMDDEWPALLDMLRYGQRSATTIVVRPDQNAVQEYLCYLESPAMGEPLQPSRTPFPRMNEIDLTWRSIGGDVDIRYWDQEEV